MKASSPHYLPFAKPFLFVLLLIVVFIIVLIQVKLIGSALSICLTATLSSVVTSISLLPSFRHWLSDLLISGLPFLLLVIFFLWMRRKATQNQISIFSFGRTKVRRYGSDHPKVTLNDMAGADEAKTELGEVVDFLLHPQKYHDLGARIPRGFLLIGPHGRALGVTEQLPGEDHYNYSRAYLIARLAVMLGGRTAEEIAIGEITTGAENDLIEATRPARRMIARWGMSNLGSMAFRTDDGQPFLGYELTPGRDFSEATAARIDQEVQQMIEERHEFVRKLLMNAREKLDLLAETLIKEETVDQEELIRILGPRPEPNRDNQVDM